MRDGRIGLLILAIGIAPAIIKKSKPLSNYLGDQLVKAGEYLKQGAEEEASVQVSDSGVETATETPPQVVNEAKPPKVVKKKTASASPENPTAEPSEGA